MSEKDAPNHNGGEPQKGGAPVQVAESIHAPEAAQPQTQGHFKEIGQEPNGTPRSILRWTRAIAAIYAVMAFFMWLQFREMRTGSVDTRALAEAAQALSRQALAQTIQNREAIHKQTGLIGQTAEQAKATNKLAREAKRSADIANEALKSQERPWVGMDRLEVLDNIDIGKVIRAKMIVRNFGRGPAIHVCFDLQLVTGCGEFPKRPAYGITGPGSHVVMLPGQQLETAETALRLPLDEATFKILKNPESGCRIYARSRITYLDIFEREHWRHVCAVWNPDTPRTMWACPFYNDGDEDYPDGKEPQ